MDNDPGIWKQLLAGAMLVISTIGGFVLRHTHTRIDRVEQEQQRLASVMANDADVRDIFAELRELRKEMHAQYTDLVDRINAIR